MEKPVVTLDQALAFIEAACGWTSVGVARDEEVSAPNSPAARTHLETVLGYNKVPAASGVDYAIRYKKDAGEYFANARRLAEYISAVGQTLEEALKD